MLAEDLTPKLLEFTFSPDPSRPCDSNPSFFDDIFLCLYKGEIHNMELLK
jgi:hypothetical protein